MGQPAANRMPLRTIPRSLCSLTLKPHDIGSQARTILFFSGIRHLRRTTAVPIAFVRKLSMPPRTWPRFSWAGNSTHTTEVFVDVETADGGGVSDAFGLAGFINVDVVRNPELGPSPYLARAMIREIIPALRRRRRKPSAGHWPWPPVCQSDAWSCAPANSGWLTSSI